MTNENAINFMLYARKETMTGSYAEEAYDMAIKALEDTDNFLTEHFKQIMDKYLSDHYLVVMEKDVADDAIKALEAQRWIPVSEEPQEGYYLITARYGKNYYVDVANYECGEWSSYSDEYKQNPREHKVVAYMPLPQPYKEGEE